MALTSSKQKKVQYNERDERKNLTCTACFNFSLVPSALRLWKGLTELVAQAPTISIFSPAMQAVIYQTLLAANIVDWTVYMLFHQHSQSKTSTPIHYIPSSCTLILLSKLCVYGFITLGTWTADTDRNCCSCGCMALHFWYGILARSCPLYWYVHATPKYKYLNVYQELLIIICMVSSSCFSWK